MANVLAASLHDLAARTATGAGTASDIGTLRTAARVVCSVAAISGTNAKIKPRLETSPDSSTWKRAGVLGELTQAGVLKATIGGLQRYVRLAYDISGTDPSVTFSASMSANVVYCEPDDITRIALPRAGLAGLTPEAILDACITASDESDSYIGNAYELPLSAWGEGLRAACARLAAAALIMHRGADPLNNGPDASIFAGKTEALKWLSRLADGRLSPPDIIDSTTETFEGGAVVVSRAARGW